MTRRVYLYFALTFVLGIIFGIASLYTYGWYTGRWHRGFNKDRIVRRLTRLLDLNDRQVQQLSQILDESQKSFSDLQRQVEPQFAALREKDRNRIRQILTPEQLTKYNEFIRQIDERRRRMPFPPPQPPPPR